MKLKKVLVAVAMAMLLAFSLCAMAACSDNSEQLIRDTLTEEIAELKNPDEATIAELSANVPNSTFAQVGLSSDEVIRALLEGFDGTVDSVTVDGKNAAAVVTISCKDFSQLEDVMDEIMADMTANVDQFAGMSYSEITTWAGEQIMDRINSLPIVQHDPTTIDYVLNGNTWEPAPGSQSKLTAEIFG